MGTYSLTAIPSHAERTFLPVERSSLPLDLEYHMNGKCR